MSGKKKVGFDSKIIYFKQFDQEITFCLIFKIGYNKLEIRQYGEDKYDLFIDENRFSDLMAQEKYEKLMTIKQKEKEKQKKKKTEDEYYRRALKYNGNDYYEGKEKTLLNNNKNKNINNNQYNYDYYKKNKNNYYNSNNYGYNNNYNNNYNNYNNNYVNNKQLNNNYINNNYNQNDYNNNINQYDQNDPYLHEEEEPKDNNQEEIDNPYPTFSQFIDAQNNKGNNNQNNINNYNTYDNTRENNNYYNNNNNNNNNNLMNQIEEVFSNENNQNNNKNKSIMKKSTTDELPTYSQITNNHYYNNQISQSQKNPKKSNKKESEDNDNNLINYIGNLNINDNNNNNNIAQTSIECAPQANNKGNYNFGFENNESDFKINDSNQIELNIYDHGKIDKERNKKKMFVNKSSFKAPLNKEDYEMDNPYDDY